MRNLANALSLYDRLKIEIRELIQEEFQEGNITFEELEGLLENHPDLLNMRTREALK